MTLPFTHSPARRTKVPLLIGIIGASGSGKTYSALRLGTGIVRVSGGKLFGLDTETRRMAHYAEAFPFEHVEFSAPFGPLRYLEALRYCVKEGAGCIVIDSASHEHEGDGGVLDMHEKELDRISKRPDGSIDWDKRKRAGGTPWVRPKAERRAMVSGIMQLPPEVALIFCFRAQEKLDWKTKDESGKLVDLGWQPISGGPLVYEMTARCLLQPGADGVPDWSPNIVAERELVKKPQQFRALFDQHKGKPLSEEMGEAMARWASGEAISGSGERGTVSNTSGVVGYTGPPVDLATANTVAELNALWRSLPKDMRASLKDRFAKRKVELMPAREPGEEG